MIKFNKNTLDITIVQGDTATFSFSLRDKNTKKSLIKEGDTIWFTLRQQLDKSIILQKEITEFNKGKVTIPLTSEETMEIEEGNYIYDLKWYRDGNVVDTLNPNRPYSNFSIKRGVK